MANAQGDEWEAQDAFVERAFREAQKKMPNHSMAKHAALANALASVLTGISGGYGGPSVREYVAEQVLREKVDVDSPLAYKSAMQILLDPKGPIYGPVTQQHLVYWCEYDNFDNDPDDIEALQKLLNAQH